MNYKSYKNILQEYKKLIKSTYDYVILNYPDKYNFKTKKQKYDAELIISEIIYFMKSGISYEYYRGPINPKSLNKHILFFSKNLIFEKVYEELYKKYTKTTIFSKLKYLSLDSSFIMNKNCKELVQRNKFFKNKNCLKISSMVDTNGIPDQIIISGGNKNDMKIGIENVRNYKNAHLNAHIKPYLLADKGYDAKEIRNLGTTLNFKSIIDHNRRNIKNVKLIKTLTKREKVIYKKRIKVENHFASLKQIKRINCIYDSKITTYSNFLYLGLCTLIYKYL